MDRNQDVEVELYEENVGNLNYSTPTGSRSSSPDRFLPVLSSQEPIQRRLEEIPFVAIDPRPDPEELSHAPTSQVPRIHDSCHTSSSIQTSLASIARLEPSLVYELNINKYTVPALFVTFICCNCLLINILYVTIRLMLTINAKYNSV